MDFQGFGNIEKWLLSKEKEAFPGNRDYAKIYSLAKDYMDTHIHSEVKAVAVKIVPEEYLNNHGSSHISDVIKRASSLLSSKEAYVSPYEAFILLMAIQLHDAGHIINGRKEHEKTVRTLIQKLFESPCSIAGLDNTEKITIYKIIGAHSGKDDPIGRLPESTDFLGERVRQRFLAAILRLSDELAEDCLRASIFLLETNSVIIDEHSKIFHKYSNALKSCEVHPESHEIVERFELSKEDVLSQIKTTKGDIYLIDEIYSRTLKTFTEMLYCNRFISEYMRITCISVLVDFDDVNKFESFLDSISYRLEEIGYPSLPVKDVFEIDKKALMREGVKVDGAYLKNKLENAS